MENSAASRKKNKQKWGGQRKQVMNESDFAVNANEIRQRERLESSSGEDEEFVSQKVQPRNFPPVETLEDDFIDDLEKISLSKKQQAFVDSLEAGKEEERLIAMGLTEESAADLDRLSEVKEERERAQRRRELEGKKKDELKAKALERAAGLESKLNSKKGGRSKKKKN